MEKFLETKLSALLGFSIPKDMIDHISTLNTEPLIREYFEGLLDPNNQRHRQFISEYINKKNLKPKQKFKKKPNRPQPAGPELYEIKSDFDELEKQYQVKKEEKQVKEEKPKVKRKEDDDLEYLKNLAKKYETPYNKYKKATFVPFEHNQRQVLLPGRRFCGCFGNQHNVINNCLNCGRIQCEQEGSGQCLFCQNLVVTNDEEAIIDRENEESRKLVSTLFNRPKPSGWEEAVANQKKLHHFDATKKERQKVFDDQTDYFTIVNSWTSDVKQFGKDNELASQMAKNAEKIKTLQIANSSTEKVTTVSAEFKDSVIKTEKSNKNVKKVKKISTGIKFDDNWRMQKARELFLDPIIAKLDPTVEVFIETLPELKMPELREKLFYQDPHTFGLLRDPKIDEEMNEGYDWDSEFWELNDYFDQLGLCISIKQPYASLIAAGIVKYESISWWSDIRGIIWIVSSEEVPTEEEIKNVENYYRVQTKESDLKLPKRYPTNRLLGRVQLLDWLERDQYLRSNPNCKIDDDFVMILDEPIPLPILLPVESHKGIYMLPKKLHTAAGLLIRRVLQDNPALALG